MTPHATPYKLTTVDTAPERASKMVRKLADEVRETYLIIHCANAERIDEVKSLVSTYHPDILLCASTWSPDETNEIKRIAREAVPNLRFYAVPQGLPAEKGQDGVIEHVKSQLSKIIEGELGSS